MNIRAERPDDLRAFARMIWRRAVLAVMLAVATTVTLAWALAVVPRPPFRLRPGSPIVMPSNRWSRDEGDEKRPFIMRTDLCGMIVLNEFAEWVRLDQPSNLQAPYEQVVPGFLQRELRQRMRPLSEGDASRAILITGWPWPCLWTSYDEQPSSGYWWYKARNGIVVRPAPPAPSRPEPLELRERTIPLRVWWAPFVADIAAWSVAWALLLHGPGVIRRSWRRHRGRCPHCGHSRVGLEVASPCPECGKFAYRIGGVTPHRNRSTP